MTRQVFKFSQASTAFYFDGSLSKLGAVAGDADTVLLTDENIHAAHKKRFSRYRTIVLPPGEGSKVQSTIDLVLQRLVEFHADRGTTLVGVGGGVITDITGFAASIYMRGIPFGFIPTTLLALVDASIGGKNGIDMGPYKNMIGVTRQPGFILHDLSFLRTLPGAEWQNGFAEIIKHACIRDARMFGELERHSIRYFRRRKEATALLIRRNARIKLRVVQQDEFEKDQRRLLNFGHTLGHAIENTTGLSHGRAISIGMHAACAVSERINGFAHRHTIRVTNLLQQYELPVALSFDRATAWDVLVHDKKKAGGSIHFIVLDRIGRARVKPVPVPEFHQIFNSIT